MHTFRTFSLPLSLLSTRPAASTDTPLQDSRLKHENEAVVILRTPMYQKLMGYVILTHGWGCQWYIEYTFIAFVIFSQYNCFWSIWVDVRICKRSIGSYYNILESTLRKHARFCNISLDASR
ncbi:hypothetical protein DFJ58DRAFT_855632 [Suillus subalutaceus]|uniref:uncharacterized protein n=1 Tax=Suillus subalutaceus TaxID=48586 RepID=UPI001B867A08|nr:uncharacterized protein DFJ58DRAFT_855632 [Suillus subalutaceus]KAG1869383.1 hypothetical protein DFJ58DRAFT_855632 [Suillus subalutaceus]